MLIFHIANPFFLNIQGKQFTQTARLIRFS